MKKEEVFFELRDAESGKQTELGRVRLPGIRI